MSLTQKLILFSLLFVTGTATTTVAISSAESDARLRAQALAACDREATQIVEVFGPELIQDKADTADRERIHAALQRMLAGAANRRAMYSVIHQDDRAVLVHEVQRGQAARKFGTPVKLSHTGHRAERTKAVQSEIVGADEAGAWITTFAPILDSSRHLLGMLVVESSHREISAARSSTWIAVLVAAVAGIIALGFLLWTVGRPLERMQRQLIAKENLTPDLVRTPADLLREVTLVIDKAHSDRDCFQARLKQQDRQRESSTRRKDELIANSVHELRTPLTSIIASLEILMDDEDTMTPEERVEFMDQASIAARHMMFIVNDMLDAAALEAGHIVVELGHCNLARMLHDARRSMEIVATARGMSLVVETRDPNLEVMADAPRLMQVIFNLVSNAVKYAPGGTTIWIRGWKSLNSAIVEVEDQGTAIPPEDRDQLFTRFSALKRESQADNVESTGIGLYLTKKLVEMMGGTIGYRPAEAGGSVFWFTLPVAPERQGLPTASSRHLGSSATLF